MERVALVYDPRDLTKPTHRHKIDGEGSPMMHHYNPENNIIYQYTKGNAAMLVMHFDEDTDKITPIEKYKAPTATNYMSFMSKNCVDPWAKEIDRAIRLDMAGDAEYIKVSMPLKSTDWVSWLYPDHISL